MSDSVFISNAKFEADLQHLSQETEYLSNSDADPSKMGLYLKEWELAGQQALKLANLDGIVSLLNMLTRVSKHNPYSALYLLSYRYQGRLALIKAEFYQASELFKDELAQAQVLKNSGAFIIASLNLAEVLQIQGRIEEAEQQLQKALQVGYEEGLVFYQARTLNRLTQLYLPQQRWDRVQISVEHAFHLLQTLKTQSRLSRAEAELVGIEEAFNRQLAGLNYATDRRWDEARTAIMESLTLSYRYQDMLGAAETQLKLGAVYYQMGRYNEALICFEDSQKVCERVGYLLGLLQADYYLSLTYFAQKQSTRALSTARRAVKVGVQMGQRGVWAAWALYQLGQVYHSFQLKQAGLALHLKAANMYQPGDQHPLWIELLMGLGEYLLNSSEDTEHWELALNCYRQAVRLMEINERMEHMAESLGKVARVFLKLKGDQGLDEAQRCYNLQLKLAGDLDTTVLPQSVAVALRVEALTGLQCVAALRPGRTALPIPAEQYHQAV